MTKNTATSIVVNKFALLAISVVVGALAGCDGATSTVTMPDAGMSKAGAAGSPNTAGSGGNEIAGSSGAGGDTQVIGTAGAGGTAGASDDASGGGGSADGGSPDGGTIGTDGGTAGTDGGTMGSDATGGTVEPACQGKVDYDDCSSPAKDTGGVISKGTPSNIVLRGKCYKGTCCSGCIANGACVPVSDQSYSLVSPQDQINNCGVNAAVCFNCNSRDNMRACTYGVTDLPHMGGTPRFIALSDGTCR